MGVLELNNNYLSDGYLQANTTQDLRFRERSLAITANQLLGEEWSLGARYRISQSKLIKDYPAVSRTVSDAFRAWQGYPLEGRFEGVLQQLSLSANFNHRCGFFGRFESHWYVQNLRQDAAAFPNEDFWQLNLFAGYRFHRSLAELQVGLLNLDDRNYHLHPLNVYYDLPRHRTFIATFKVHF
jgi:outer membrane receptor for monomeric catechols